jgi:hypothetical protein
VLLINGSIVRISDSDPNGSPAAAQTDGFSAVQRREFHLAANTSVSA